MKKINQEDVENEAKGIPPRFGYRHEVRYNLENSGEWTDLPNGDKIWQLEISCSGALSINLLYDKFWVPDGAKFFIYSNDRKQHIGAFTSINNKGDKANIDGFATGLIYGDQITLEYYLPKSINEIGVISVAYVVQGYRYIKSNNTKNYGSSGSCNINVNCTQGQGWQNERNAVAMILVDGNRYCTGSLINTTAGDSRPLFLTADHCLGGWANSVKYDAISAPNLSHWSFYWHYESPSCANSSPAILSTSSATVVANNAASDFALLRLSEDPRNKNGVTPYYLGWDRSGNSGTGGVGIHHPSGDIKKISIYTITPASATYNSSTATNGHWRIVWNQGTTEGGSSGSPVINNNHRVLGQLHGGNASCSNLSGYDYYGKFSVSWTGNGATDNRRRLIDWLDPFNTGVSVLDGCNGVVNYANTTVTGNVTVTSCGVLNTQNVTVQNGRGLTLNAKQVNIKEPFTVQYGAGFIVNAQ
jgi:hypothetical protein